MPLNLIPEEVLAPAVALKYSYVQFFDMPPLLLLPLSVGQVLCLLLTSRMWWRLLYHVCVCVRCESVCVCVWVCVLRLGGKGIMASALFSLLAHSLRERPATVWCGHSGLLLPCEHTPRSKSSSSHQTFR